MPRCPHSLMAVALLLGACAGPTAPTPVAVGEGDPWAGILAEGPAPEYPRQFHTLAHQLLDLDSQIEQQPEAMYQLLDVILADAQKRIHFDGRERDPIKRRKNALAALGAIDRLLMEHNIIYPPTGDINSMHEGLVPHHLSREDIMLAAGRVLQTPAGDWIGAHSKEAFYFMDCDILTFMYIAIGQVVGMPLEMAALPNHAFIRYELGGNVHIDWETTVGEKEVDETYEKRYQLTRWNKLDRAFMVDMTPREMLGYYLCCRGVWQENTNPPDYAGAAADYERSITLYPQCELARNNLAWLYLSIPGLSGRTREEVLQLALGALAVMPLDANIADTVACAYAELGDFAKAISFEQQAIAAAAVDPEVTTTVRNELAERLEVFLSGRTYLEALADGDITPVTPQQRKEH